MLLLFLTLWAADAIVAPAGGDFTTIQAALDVAQAGDTIFVETGIYQEQIVFPHSGNAVDGAITLRAQTGHQPILDGTGFLGGNMVLMQNRSWIIFQGFEIRNLSQIDDGSGIRIIGTGDEIELRGHEIHHMLGSDAMGITVYGTQSTAITNLRIIDNWIHDCEPARSEALTLNGNIDGFLVENNRVNDVNNIGIDFIGGETSINPNPAMVARNGICRGNQVTRARANYGGGYGAGIYVDGGRNIVIDGNQVTQCDLGIEIGAENNGTNAELITVRNNWVHRNDKAGIVFGGFDASVGRVMNSLFINNTCYFNDTLGEGLGELWIQYASGNRIENNIFFGRPGTTIHYSETGNVNNSLNYNLWFATTTPEWVWQNQTYSNFSAFQTGSNQDAAGSYQDPQLLDPDNGDGHLGSNSPAIGLGDLNALPGEVGSVDFDGESRIQSRIDIGMDEFTALPPCLPDRFAAWLQPTDQCTATLWLVTTYTALINQICTCQP